MIDPKSWFSALAALVATCISSSAAEWKPIERVETYAISGTTGAELYASIGERGPGKGSRRAIAQTTFRLTWTRDYRPSATSCTLASATPKLVVTTVLPVPSSTLPSGVQESWERFIAGVRTHEAVHAAQIVEMVKKIEAATVGLSVPNDPACKKIRAEMQPILASLSKEQRNASRDFDGVELADGGAVHKLVLQLVNGP